MVRVTTRASNLKKGRSMKKTNKKAKDHSQSYDASTAVRV